MFPMIIFSILAYFLGSLSSAVIVCKLLALPDPRSNGSTNPGATNVLRLGGKIPALITLGGDFLKGFLPLALAQIAGIHGFYLSLIALAAFLGHLFPIFFNFHGGKGVATFMGTLTALSPFVGFLLGMCWLGVAYFTRYSSLAALISALIAPIVMFIFGHSSYIMAIAIMVAILLWRHRNNIHRLRAGTESKIVFLR